MKKKLLLTLQILGGLFAVLLIALGGLAIVVNTPAIQNRVLHKATEMLSEKLGTKASIDSVYIDVMRQNLELYGVSIDDQQQRKLFEMEQMVVDLDLTKLLASKIEVEKARVAGLRANIVDKPGEESNYQYILDALKKDKSPDDTLDTKQEKSKLKFDLRNVKLEDVKLSYNDIELDLVSVGADLDGNLKGQGSIKDVTLSYQDKLIHLDCLQVEFGERWKDKAIVENLRTHWTAQTKKGPVETTLEIDRLELKPDDEVGRLKLHRLHYTTDNHQPRKNAVKPKRGALTSGRASSRSAESEQAPLISRSIGAFDTGHLNVWADLEAELHYMAKDTLFARITDGCVTDTLTGFFVKDLRALVNYIGGTAYVQDLAFSHQDTHVSIDSARMQLPNKKRGTRLAYKTGTITVNTLLKDISTPFAPVLKNFTMPLTVTTTMTGHEDGMTFDNVHVTTPDRQLDIRAKGGIANLKDKEELSIRFDIANMHTNSTKVMEIINQFAVKKLMTDQLKSLKTIDYQGELGIYRKNERFSGCLATQDGDINFKISIDETNKVIDGNIDSKAFNVGKAFNVKTIGDVALTGDFRVDISKERTAQMRKDKNGKLPIGTAQIQVKEVKLGKARLTDIFADISSDGATALLDVDKPGRVANTGFDIRYTSTTAGTKVKVKPKLRFNIFK